MTPIVYIAASFKHRHAVRLLGLKLKEFGYKILDWTDKATPPQGLSVSQRREWMDTDVEGGDVFSFCKNSCLQADILVYFGESGQDAGVEVGLACGAGVPLLGIRGTLEAPGLMLYGAVDVWVEDIEEALTILQKIAIIAEKNVELSEDEFEGKSEYEFKDGNKEDNKEDSEEDNEDKSKNISKFESNKIIKILCSRLHARK